MKDTILLMSLLPAGLITVIYIYCICEYVTIEIEGKVWDILCIMGLIGILFSLWMTITSLIAQIALHLIK